MRVQYKRNESALDLNKADVIYTTDRCVSTTELE